MTKRKRARLAGGFPNKEQVPIPCTLLAQLRFQSRCAIRGLTTKEILLRKRALSSGKKLPKALAHKVNEILVDNSFSSKDSNTSRTTNLKVDIPVTNPRRFGEREPVRKSPLSGRISPVLFPNKSNVLLSERSLESFIDSGTAQQPKSSPNNKQVVCTQNEGDEYVAETTTPQLAAETSLPTTTLVISEATTQNMTKDSSKAQSENVPSKSMYTLLTANTSEDNAVLMTAELDVLKAIVLREEAIVGARALYVKLHGELVRISHEEVQCVKDAPDTMFDVSKIVFSKLPKRKEMIHMMQHDLSNHLERIRTNSIQCVQHILEWSKLAKHRLHLGSKCNLTFVYHGEPYAARMNKDLQFLDGVFDEQMRNQLIAQHMPSNDPAVSLLKPRKRSLRKQARFSEFFESSTLVISGWLGCRVSQNPLLRPSVSMQQQCFAQRLALAQEANDRKERLNKVLQRMADEIRYVVFAAIYGEGDIDARTIFGTTNNSSIIRLLPCDSEFFSQSCRMSCSLCFDTNRLVNTTKEDSQSSQTIPPVVATNRFRLSNSYFKKVIALTELSFDAMGVELDSSVIEHDREVGQMCYSCFMHQRARLIHKSKSKRQFQLVNWFSMQDGDKELLQGRVILSPQSALLPPVTQEEEDLISKVSNMFQDLLEADLHRVKVPAEVQALTSRLMQSNVSPLSRFQTKISELCQVQLSTKATNELSVSCHNLVPQNHKLVSPTYKGNLSSPPNHLKSKMVTCNITLPIQGLSKTDNSPCSTPSDKNAMKEETCISLQVDQTSTMEGMVCDFEEGAAILIQSTVRGHLARHKVKLAATRVDFLALGGQLLRVNDDQLGDRIREQNEFMYYIQQHKAEQARELEALLLRKHKTEESQNKQSKLALRRTAQHKRIRNKLLKLQNAFEK